jgi:hypothetical protein
VKGKIICLDAGFNDRDLTTEISLLNMKPYIFPKKINNINGDVYWQKMYLEFYYNTLDGLKYQVYHNEQYSQLALYFTENGTTRICDLYDCPHKVKQKLEEIIFKSI